MKTSHLATTIKILPKGFLKELVSKFYTLCCVHVLDPNIISSSTTLLCSRQGKSFSAKKVPKELGASPTHSWLHPNEKETKHDFNTGLLTSNSGGGKIESENPESLEFMLA